MSHDEAHPHSLTLTPEQEELRRLLRRFFTDSCGSAYVRKRIEQPHSSDSELWSGVRALGLFELFDPEDGGFGVHELSLIAHEAGRATVPEAITEFLLTGPLLARFGLPDSIKERKAIVSGTRRVALAPASLRTVATLSAKKTSVSGKVSWIRSLDQCSYLLAAVSVGGATQFALIECSEGVATTTPRSGLDGTMKLFDVSLSEAPAFLLPPSLTEPLHCAEMVTVASQIVGCCERAFEMTLEYSKTRTQFDVPIGSFQVIQHRLAEMYLQLEAMRALTNFAAWTLDASPEQRTLSSYAALAYTVEEGPKVIESSIQLHGGIGFTWEYDLHLLLRRVRALEMLYRPGDEDMRVLLRVAHNDHSGGETQVR